MAATLRLILIVAAAAFGLASSIHAGVLLDGWEHSRAATAEGAITAAMALGIAASLIRPASARGIALAALGFALLGTLVGAFTILVGVGPQSAPDIALPALLILGLAAALIRVWRLR